MGDVGAQSSIWISLNDIYSHWAFILCVAFGLAAWTIRAAWPLTRAARAIRSAAKKMRETLVLAGDHRDVAREYQTLTEQFRTDPVLGDSWSAMTSTVLTPGRGGGDVYRQTVPASDFFNLELLGLAGADLRSARAHANALVGVGLILTFLGLVFALKAAGGSLGAGDPTQVRDGLAVLLGTAAAKFSFSVVALLLSIISAAWVRRETRSTEHALSRLNGALDRRLPPLTPQELAADTQSTLRGDIDARRAETERLAEILAQRFDAALNERLRDAIEPLASAIGRMTTGVSENNRKQLEQMSKAFLDRLEASAGTEIREATTAMERVGGHIAGLAQTLNTVREGLAGAGSAAAQEIAQAASDASRGMADAMTMATAAIADSGPKWEESSARAATSLREAMADGTRAFGLALELAGASLEKKIVEAGEAAGDRLTEGARKSEGYLARSAADAARELRAAGKAVATGGKEAETTLVEAAEQAANTLVDSVTVATSRLIAGSKVLDDSATNVGNQVQGLASTMGQLRAAASDGVLLVANAASALDAAATKITESTSPKELVAELRAAAARLMEATTSAVDPSSEAARTSHTDGSVIDPWVPSSAPPASDGQAMPVASMEAR
ncbi:hypothetical protein [Neoroseomonas rubea]|uniref:hypothetical protein n=1 Tax=Neoroseomonas rubea TaxID=2748666 RepID=UPI0018DF0181|nr:hypothetical protein [Roseomonas rubea]